MRARNSAKSWLELQNSPYLTQARKNVYQWLCLNGPSTQRRIDNALGTSAHKRISELVIQGFIEKITNIICPVTGKLVGLYKVKDFATPRELPKSDLSKIARIKLLEAMLADLIGYPDW